MPGAETKGALLAGDAMESYRLCLVRMGEVQWVWSAWREGSVRWESAVVRVKTVLCVKAWRGE